MPEPRVRRSKPRVPRAGQSRAATSDVETQDVATPDVETQDAVSAPASLAPADAASAEAEAELEAAASIAAAGGAATAGADSGPDAERTPGDLAAPGLEPGPEPDAAADGDVEAESAGWFRDEPLGGDGSASGDVTGVEPEADGEGELEPGPGPEPEADVAPVIRERDRPVVTTAPIVEGPPRPGRLRRFLIGVATIAIVAAAGFVAGLMLPVVLPGPGISTGSPSPSAAATPVPTAAGGPTTEPSIAPSATPSPQLTPEPTPAPTPVVYVVKRGDLLSRIASTYGVTVAAIQEANNIENPNLIRVGQKLIIPLPVASPTP